MFSILDSLEILQMFDGKHHEQEQPVRHKYVISPLIVIAQLSLANRSDVNLSPKIPFDTEPIHLIQHCWSSHIFLLPHCHVASRAKK